MAVDLEIDGAQPSPSSRRDREQGEKGELGRLPAGGEGRRRGLGSAAGGLGCNRAPTALPETGWNAGNFHVAEAGLSTSSSARNKRSSPGLPTMKGVDGEESVERGGGRGKVRVEQGSGSLLWSSSGASWTRCREGSRGS